MSEQKFRFPAILKESGGQALVIALLSVLLIAVLVAAITFLASSDIFFSTAHKESKRALDTAEAGLAKAIWYFENQGQIPTSAAGNILTTSAPPSGYPDGDGAASGTQWNWQIWRPGNTVGGTSIPRYKEKFGDGEFEVQVDTVSGTPYTLSGMNLSCGVADCLNNHVVRITSKGTVAGSSRTVSRMVALTPVTEEFAISGLGKIGVQGATNDTLIAPLHPGRWIVENGVRKENKGGGLGTNGELNFQDTAIRLNYTGSALYNTYFGQPANQAIPGDIIKPGPNAKVTVQNDPTDISDINVLRAQLSKLNMTAIKKLSDPIPSPTFNWGMDMTEPNPVVVSMATDATTWHNQAIGINPFFVANQAVSVLNAIAGPTAPNADYPAPYNTDTSSLSFPYNMTAIGYPLGSPGIQITGNPVAGEYYVYFDNEQTLTDAYGSPYKRITMHIKRETAPITTTDYVLTQVVDYNPNLVLSTYNGSIAPPYNVVPLIVGNDPFSAVSVAGGGATGTTPGDWDIYVYKQGGNWHYIAYRNGAFYGESSGSGINPGIYTNIIPGISITTGSLSCSGAGCPDKCGYPGAPCSGPDTPAWRASFKITGAAKTYYPPTTNTPSGISLNFTDGHPLNGEKAAFRVTGEADPMFKNTGGSAVANVFDAGAVWNVIYDGSTYYTLSKDQTYTLTVSGSGSTATFDVTSITSSVPSGVTFNTGPFSAAAGTENDTALQNLDIYWNSSVNAGDTILIKTGNPVKEMIIDKDFVPQDTYTLQVVGFGAPYKVYVKADSDSTGSNVTTLNAVNAGETHQILTDVSGRTVRVRFGDLTDDAHAHIFTRGVVYDTTVSPARRHPDLKNAASNSSKDLLDEINTRFDNFRLNMHAFGWDQTTLGTGGTSGTPNHIYGNFYLRSSGSTLPSTLAINGNTARIRNFTDLATWINDNTATSIDLRGYNYVWMPSGNVFNLANGKGLRVKNGALILDGALVTGTGSLLVIQHPNLNYPDSSYFSSPFGLVQYSGPSYIGYMPGLMIRKYYAAGGSLGDTSADLGNSSVHVDGIFYSARNGQIQGSLFVTGSLVSDAVYDPAYANMAFTNNNGRLIIRYDKEHSSKVFGKAAPSSLPAATATPIGETWIDKLTGLF